MLLTNRRGQPQMGDALSAALAKADRVWIVSAYITPSGCESAGLMEAARRCELHVAIGRAVEEGLPRETISYLSRLDGIASAKGGGVRAADPPCHSKIYVVEGGSTMMAWIGSSNLTPNGLQNWVEANLEIVGAPAGLLLAEAQDTWTRGRALASVREAPVPRPTAKPGRVEAGTVPITEPGSGAGAPSLSLSLLSHATGEVQTGGGLNWWHGGGRPRHPDEAYVALPAAALPSAREIFGSTKPATKFYALCHDGTTFEMVLEGKQAGGQAKQISTAGDKRLFGKWILRKCLRLPANTLVRKRHLVAYGRTDIRFTRIGTAKNGQPVVFVDFKP